MLIFLHAGCGSATKAQTTPYFASDSWREIRLDIDPGVQPDIVGSIVDLPGIADNAYDAVFSSHNIEHLYPYEVPVALQSFRRVLKRDGHLVLACPDLESVCAHVAAGRLLEPLYNSPAGPVAALDILYGYRAAIHANSVYMAHRCGFIASALRDALHGAGFGMVWVRRDISRFALSAVAIQDSGSETPLRELVNKHFPSPGDDHQRDAQAD